MHTTTDVPLDSKEAKSSPTRRSGKPNRRNRDSIAPVAMLLNEKLPLDDQANDGRKMTCNICRKLQRNEHSTTSSTPD
jgi:hypothetical protein